MKKHEHSGCAGKSLENPQDVLIKAGFKKGNAVLLDIGMGTGYLSIAAAEIMGSGSRVYALDSHEESVKVLVKKLAEKGISNITAIKADAVNDIPLQRAIADICLMSNVVHGFAANDELDAVMKNINRALREEGKMIVIDFKKNNTDFGPPPDIKLSPEEMDEKLSPYGYKLEKSFEAGPNHYCLVFKRVSLQDKYC